MPYGNGYAFCASEGGQFEEEYMTDRQIIIQGEK